MELTDEKAQWYADATAASARLHDLLTCESLPPRMKVWAKVCLFDLRNLVEDAAKERGVSACTRREINFRE